MVMNAISEISDPHLEVYRSCTSGLRASTNRVSAAYLRFLVVENINFPTEVDFMLIFAITN